jgi:hypothetical protein
MNERIKALAKQAGFIFWKDESWGPGPDNIDWSCDYQIEFNTFVQSLIKECAKVANNNFDKGFCPVGQHIKEEFSVK